MSTLSALNIYFFCFVYHQWNVESRNIIPQSSVAKFFDEMPDSTLLISHRVVVVRLDVDSLVRFSMRVIRTKLNRYLLAPQNAAHCC